MCLCVANFPERIVFHPLRFISFFLYLTLADTLHINRLLVASEFSFCVTLGPIPRHMTFVAGS